MRNPQFVSICDRKENVFGAPLSPALRKLSRPKAEEIYGFVPALALGGPSKFENLEKLKIVEHLVFLAQLSALQVMNTPPR
ncbi:MAG TPA: T6SS immunity protein Tdi1 domain-containing protein [Ideonella sp.]|nr:T6SS immunity protein Tdi1 domain-containing protein [Ideonella sp.]